MITQFKDENRWLSNFYPVEVVFEGRTYRSVEHAYQAAKSTELEWRLFCLAEASPGKVRRRSRKIEVRDDWEWIKVSVMRELLEQKFAQESFRNLLLETGDQALMEGNTWGDRFWGVDLQSGQGYNILGQLLMEIRRSLHSQTLEV